MPPIIRAVSGPSKQTRAPHPNKAGLGGPPESSGRKRILALDVGSKRIGLAVSDPLRILARGLDTLHRQSKRVDFERLGEILKEEDIGEIVVGHPLRLGGEESAQTVKVLAFAEELRARFGLPVHLWEERLTSVEAAEILVQKKRSVKRHIAERKSGAVDRMAAVLILQSYLDQCSKTPTES